MKVGRDGGVGFFEICTPSSRHAHEFVVFPRGLSFFFHFAYSVFFSSFFSADCRRWRAHSTIFQRHRKLQERKRKGMQSLWRKPACTRKKKSGKKISHKGKRQKGIHSIKNCGHTFDSSSLFSTEMPVHPPSLKNTVVELLVEAIKTRMRTLQSVLMKRSRPQCLPAVNDMFPFINDNIKGI